MAHSEAQKKIIKLGKQLVEELGIEPGVDTVSRWMAHYLAEQITIAEQLDGDTKSDSEKECFDIILKLWKQRWFLPSNHRPFDNFEPILDTLNKIGADSVESPFFNRPDIFKKLPKIASIDFENIQGDDWLTIANQIDKTARLWLRHSMKQYALHKKSDKTDDWLMNSDEILDHLDTKIIRKIFDKDNVLSADEFEQQYYIEELEDRIAVLESFKSINEFLLSSFKKELSELNINT